MKKLCLILLVLLLTTSAFAFEAEMYNSAHRSNEIYRDEVASLTLDITNTEVTTQRYTFFTPNPNWIVTTNDTLLEVANGETKSYEVSVDPTTAIQNTGIYSVEFTVQRSNSNEEVNLERDILIKSEYSRTLNPQVSMTVIVGNKSVVDPRDGVPVRILFKNNNALSLEDIDVSVRLLDVEDTFTVSLDPNAEIIKEFNYDIPVETKPGSNTLVVTARYDEKVIQDKRVVYSVQENLVFFTRENRNTSVQEFLYEQYDITLRNNGNLENTETFTFDVGLFARIFTSTDPAAEYEGGEAQFTLTLGPGESVDLTIITDYRTTFWAILIVLALVGIVYLLYLALRSPVILDKKAVVVGERDGGTSEVKILINVKNRSRKAIENITLLDRIPGITEIEREFSIGTLKPKKIVRHPKKGTLIKWEFPSMDAFEERIITYRIHSKLGILGNLNLPQGIVKFHTPDGKGRIFKSNVIQHKEE